MLKKAAISAAKNGASTQVEQPTLRAGNTQIKSNAMIFRQACHAAFLQGSAEQQE